MPVDSEQRRVHSELKSRPRVLALFSGAGGLDLGFSRAGFDVAVSSDIDPTCLASVDLNAHRHFGPQHRSVCVDVSCAKFEDFGDERFDFMIGGPPCQSFSAAGRRAGGVHGVNDFRGSLFWHYCRLIEHFRPRGFLFENVRGILQANGGRDWEIIKAAFSSLGFTIRHRVLDAADYGVAQHRERLIVVGTKTTDFLFPRPTHGPSSAAGKPHVTSGQAIGELDDPKMPVPVYPGKWGTLVAEVPPGRNYLHFTEELGHPKPVFGWRSRFSDFLYKLDPNAPSRTIVASQGAYGGPFHWRGRKLTLLEHKRLQSFPDDYEFSGSHLRAIKQIGNSVAPLFAECLAGAVLQQVFNSSGNVELMSSEFNLSFDTRKRTKAASTRLGRRSSAVVDSNQLSLWGLVDSREACDTNHRLRWGYSGIRERSPHEHGSIYHFDAEVTRSSKGFRVTARQLNTLNTARLEIDLSFVPSEVRDFSSIHVAMDLQSLKLAAVAWDLVNWCVRSGSTYRDIQPLYGHFTEPHPKFELRVQASDSTYPGLAELIRVASTFGYVTKLRSLTELNDVLPAAVGITCARMLRDLGWDIRTNQTNRAIPPNQFRLAYPFTMSLDEPRFTTWRETGTHRHADRSAIPT